MFEWIASLFQSIVADMVFLSICVAGAAFTVFSMMFGGDHDGHEGMHFGHGDAGGHDVGHDGDAHHGDHGQEDGPSYFSFRGMVLFATGFGGVGYLVQHYTGKTLVASVAGLVAGVVLALIGISIIRMFFHQQASSLVPATQAVGTMATVITSIPADGMGEVSFVLAGVQTTRAAIGNRGSAIPSGREVKIVRIVGHQVVVEEMA